MNLFHWDTATTLAVVLSFVIPALSAAAARGKIPANVAGGITLVVAALNGFFTEWADSSSATHYDWKSAAGIALFSLGVAILSHYGLWKGTDTEGHLLAIGNGSRPAVEKAAV